MNKHELNVSIIKYLNYTIRHVLSPLPRSCTVWDGKKLKCKPEIYLEYSYWRKCQSRDGKEAQFTFSGSHRKFSHLTTRGRGRVGAPVCFESSKGCLRIMGGSVTFSVAWFLCEKNGLVTYANN